MTPSPKFPFRSAPCLELASRFLASDGNTVAAAPSPSVFSPSFDSCQTSCPYVSLFITRGKVHLPGLDPFPFFSGPRHLAAASFSLRCPPLFISSVTNDFGSRSSLPPFRSSPTRRLQLFGSVFLFPTVLIVGLKRSSLFPFARGATKRSHHLLLYPVTSTCSLLTACSVYPVVPIPRRTSNANVASPPRCARVSPAIRAIVL